MEPSSQPSQLAYAAVSTFGRPSALPFFAQQPQLPSYPQIQQLHRQQEQQLQTFWLNQMHEIEQISDFKNHSLPLARIKKIMKADEDVRMISAEAPVIFAKACEMLILELTLRSWIHTEENKRRTLQKNDIAAAVSRTDIFDFLVDIVPRDELREDSLLRAAALQGMGLPMDTLPYYCVPAHLQVTGKPSDQAADHPSQAHPMAYVWPALGEDKAAPNA